MHARSRTLLYFLLVIIGLSGLAFLVFLPTPSGVYSAIVAAGLGGLGVAVNVHVTKQHGGQLVCPTGSNCNAVITSRYAEFFGVPLEYWGILYYAVIVMAYLAFLFVPAVFTPPMVTSIVILSAFAGLFSLYLLFVQSVLIGQWCIWCILSAMLSLGVCVLSFISAPAVIGFLAQQGQVLAALQSLGLALGLGGVSAFLLLFFQFLQDHSVSKKELRALQGVFELVWVGVGFLLVGKFGRFVVAPDALAGSSVFAAQMIALAVAVIAGTVLMIVYAPYLQYIPFGRRDTNREDGLADIRRPVLSVGAVAVVSWYFIFFVGFASGGSLVYFLVLLLALLTLAVLAALAGDRYLPGSSG